MQKSKTYFLFPLLLLILLSIGLSESLFNLPALGKFFDPFKGVVRNDADDRLTMDFMSTDLGLKDSVNVYFDDRQVPHIYANNAQDLYFTQGYVCASLRLYQMDIITRRTAGRLSEWYPNSVIFDRHQRRQGVLKAAKKSLKFIEKDAQTLEVLNAYTRGVNAYIDQLTYDNMPVEYKMLNRSVDPWTNLKSVLMMKYMSAKLSKHEDDLEMTNLMLTLGEEKFNMIFPDYHNGTKSMITKGETDEKKTHVSKPSYLDDSYLLANHKVEERDGSTLGSNCWAVSGKKTKSGFPILAADPHLGLSLPAIWLEMQLSSPEVNVYGVSIPGTPSIIIGFNEEIAWGMTNGSDDIKDWYKVKINEDFTKYKLDDKWVDLEKEIEEIKIVGQPSFYDTVYSTVHGPIVITKGFDKWDPELLNLALKWGVHEPSDEFLTFIKLNRAKSYKDYNEAISHYKCPIQNFIFAGKDNDIAINHQGRMPIKDHKQGRFVLDGTKSELIYTEYIPKDSLPHIYNPETNYVFSANQRPTDANYSYYYNGYYDDARATQIEKLLKSEQLFDIDKMKEMQLNNVNSFALEAKAILLDKLTEYRLEETQASLVKSLTNWEGTYNKDDKTATFFELWWKNIEKLTWDEFKQYSFEVHDPNDYVLLGLIDKDPNNEFFNIEKEEGKQSAGDVVYKAFLAAETSYQALENTNWSEQNKVFIVHPSKLLPFSRVNLLAGGHPKAINATSKFVAPSWRMVVELGDRPVGYGIFPGGQSGNIVSPYYDNYINDWIDGNYYPLQFYMSAEEASKHQTAKWILK